VSVHRLFSVVGVVPLKPCACDYTKECDNRKSGVDAGHDDEGGFHARGCDREEAISHLANRWAVFKLNYAPRACIKDLSDANWSGDEFPALLEVDCLAFAEVRNGGEE